MKPEIRVESKVTSEENDKLQEYADTVYAGNRGLAIREAIKSLIARKGL